MATEGKTKAPVDGKRLASLEAGVSSLALALSANGIELKEGQDPCVQAIVVIKRWHELTAARAELQLAVAIAVDAEPETIEDPFAAAAGALEAMKARVVDVEGQLETSRKRIVEIELENGELHQDVEDLANARNTLANQLAEEGKGQGAAVEEVKAPEPVAPVRERSENARDVGPAIRSLSYAELQQVIGFPDGAFEVAFSDGEFEIPAFTPEKINPASLARVDSSRFLLQQAITLRGGDRAEEIHGAGLLLGGTQIAYCTFEPPLTVQPNHEWKFDRTLIFA